MKPQGWYNAIDFPATLMANNTNTDDNAGAGHVDFQALSANQQASVKLMKAGCLCKHQGNIMRSQDRGHGKNCTLFVFENAANGCLDSAVLNPKKAGELQAMLNCGANPRTNITIILFGEFENLLEIDKNKAVLYGIYQR